MTSFFRFDKYSGIKDFLFEKENETFKVQTKQNCIKTRVSYCLFVRGTQK